MVEAAGRMEDPFLFFKLLQHYLGRPKRQSLALTARFLARLPALLVSRNPKHVAVALDLLDQVTRSPTADLIVQCLAAATKKRHQIGVDLAAEERLEVSSKIPTKNRKKNCSPKNNSVKRKRSRLLVF